MSFDEVSAPVSPKKKGKAGLYGFLYSAFTEDVQFFLM